ncbi:MAG TPA: LacI family DNA-binding transcriptional regulator [Armatimonadota bacterium]|nr:LacI family DNA-binding transcriptional regulator [Armatimonadota bacterium]
MQPTIKDVARQAGVSTATVSRVLNEAIGVSEHTRLRVDQAISDLGYRYNALASSLKKQQSSLIGHIVPSIAGPVAPVLARAVEEEAQKSGYNVILCNSSENVEKEKANVNVLLERRVEGIVFTAPMMPEHVKAIKARNVPVVIIERRWELAGFPFVEPDNFKAAYDAVKYLLKLGHKRIAMIVGPPSAIISKLRMDGYERALMDVGLGLDGNLTSEGNYTRVSGYEAMQKFLGLEKRPTAVFAANDAMAIGAMQAAFDAGLKAPEDISFVGFDDTYAELTIPQLTTVHQPLHEIGTLATKIIMAQMNESGDQYPLENVLTCYLKERSSCAKV